MKDEMGPSLNSLVRRARKPRMALGMTPELRISLETPIKPVSMEVQSSPELVLIIPDGNPRPVSLGWLPKVGNEANHRSHD